MRFGATVNDYEFMPERPDFEFSTHFRLLGLLSSDVRADQLRFQRKAIGFRMHMAPFLRRLMGVDFMTKRAYICYPLNALLQRHGCK